MSLPLRPGHRVTRWPNKSRLEIESPACNTHINQQEICISVTVKLASMSDLGASGSSACLINEAADAAGVAIAISADADQLNHLTHCVESQFHSAAQHCLFVFVFACIYTPQC